MKARLLASISLGITAAVMAAMPMAANAQAAPTDYNYVGLGAGIGDLGTSDLGLAINGKATIANNVSVRPAVISDLNFNDDGETVFLAPVTYDISATADGRLVPFVGGGVSFSTEGAGAIGPLVTAGVDYRITDNLTANGSVNWSIYGNDQVNGIVGLGYTF